MNVHKPGLTVGIGTYYAADLSVRRWDNSEHAIVGKYCSIADGVSLFCGGGHRTSLVSTWPFDPLMRNTRDIESRTYKQAETTVIGHDVWIASGATIMPGVKIGNGAVIGPHAVVFEDVDPFFVVRGNPAKVVRRRHDYQVCDVLQRIAWWDWDYETIEARLDDFYLPVHKFVEKYQ